MSDESYRLCDELEKADAEIAKLRLRLAAAERECADLIGELRDTIRQRDEAEAELRSLNDPRR